MNEGFSRRGFLTAAAAVGAGAWFADAPAIAYGGSTTLRWLGVNVWEIAVGSRRIVVDPYVTRFKPRDGDLEGTPLTVDQAAIDRHLPGADLVLVTQTHYDHVSDLPYLVSRTGAQVIGTETSYHLLRAMGVDSKRLTVASGGEYLDFGDFTVQVFRSLHSLNTPTMQYVFPGTLNAKPAAPTTVGELVEGGTLAYLVTVGELKIFMLGTANLVERELAGLRPDVAILAAPTSDFVHRYTERAMRALGNPAVVFPTHWDDMVSPLDGPIGDPADLRPFAQRIRRLSPGTAFVVPEPLRPYRV